MTLWDVGVGSTLCTHSAIKLRRAVPCVHTALPQPAYVFSFDAHHRAVGLYRSPAGPNGCVAHSHEYELAYQRRTSVLIH